MLSQSLVARTQPRGRLIVRPVQSRANTVNTGYLTANGSDPDPDSIFSFRQIFRTPPLWRVRCACRVDTTRTLRRIWLPKPGVLHFFGLKSYPSGVSSLRELEDSVFSADGPVSALLTRETLRCGQPGTEKQACWREGAKGVRMVD